jgi:uncharacterized protein
MEYIIEVAEKSWELLVASSIYILFGILIGGLLKVFISPASVSKHLGTGRVMSVIKASLFGVPMPLCSCGVLPTAATLRKQGANRGATTSFLISTPESGVDSIAITYALLGPVMMIARPLAGMVTAIFAGVLENLISKPEEDEATVDPDLSCSIDGCCDGVDCPEDEHKAHHTFSEKLSSGMKYSFGELWGDLAGWFFIGIFISGIITALIPDDVFSSYLGGGLTSMLLMLVIGIPMYICATGSTPIAAALILKGVSPGAALVFLMAGPATNITSISVVTGILGKRATVIYLASIAVFAVLSGLLLDLAYGYFGFSVIAMTGHAHGFVPESVKYIGVAILFAISIKPLYSSTTRLFKGKDAQGDCGCGSCEIEEHEDSHGGCDCEDNKAKPVSGFGILQNTVANEEVQECSCGCSLEKPAAE